MLRRVGGESIGAPGSGNGALVRVHRIIMLPVTLPGLLSDLMDFCYPGVCTSCDVRTEQGRPLCRACDEQLARLEARPACGFCGKPVGEADGPCPYCGGEGIAHYDRVVGLGTFNDPLKHLIHRMKFHGRWAVAEMLADRLAARERVAAMLRAAEVILPIPLHRLRHVTRGYNQAEVVARRVVKRHGHLRLAKPGVRVRDTAAQTSLTSAAHREENMRDAFALVDPRAIRRRHVVVVDDVTTTGATLRAFARALRPARPASLCAVVLAVADPKGRDFQSI